MAERSQGGAFDARLSRSAQRGIRHSRNQTVRPQPTKSGADWPPSSRRKGYPGRARSAAAGGKPKTGPRRARTWRTGVAVACNYRTEMNSDHDAFDATVGAES